MANLMKEGSCEQRDQIRQAVLPLVGAICCSCGEHLGQYIALFYRGWAFPGSFSRFCSYLP